MSRARARLGCRAVCRQAWAICVVAASRWRLTAKLRRVAMLAGPWPVRIWDRSSPKETSRIQWRASICQCPRMTSAISFAGAWRQVRVGHGRDRLAAEAG